MLKYSCLKGVACVAPIKTFKRYELKYQLNRQQYEAMLKGMMPYANADPYCIDGKTYGLYNIYFDDDNYSLIRHSVSKPAFKEKLRLRSYYADPKPDDKVFIELKKKADGCVNKRRVTMKYADALRFLETGKGIYTGDYLNDQVVKEIEYFLKFYVVSPKAFIAYDRAAYFLKEDKKIRITFDTNVRGGPAELGEAGCKLLVPEDTYLMEVKISDHIPLWMVKIMSENKIFRHGFSKYGSYFENYIIPRKEVLVK